MECKFAWKAIGAVLMKISALVKNSIVALASLGIVVPQAGMALAAPPVSGPMQSDSVKVPDISLNGRGQLVGQVVNHQGIARANSNVTVSSPQGEVLQRTKTDDKGRFAFEMKKGGAYVVSGT